MLELQYELEAKKKKIAAWYATIDIANVFLSIPVAPEFKLQLAFPGGKHSTPGTTCSGDGSMVPASVTDLRKWFGGGQCPRSLTIC